jgi:hypothetical protein
VCIFLNQKNNNFYKNYSRECWENELEDKEGSGKDGTRRTRGRSGREEIECVRTEKNE